MTKRHVSWTDALVENPRKLWVRRALFQVHLWTGLAVGVYMLVSGVSGSALVFHEELGDLAQAHLHRVPSSEVGGRRRLTLDEAAAALAHELPGQKVLSIAPPQQENGTFQAGLIADKYRVAFVHPVTGRVTGPVEPGGDIMSWLHELHANLLSGGTGRWWNGIGGGLLFLLCVTGIVIWWPGRSRWMRGLTIDRRAGWKRLVFDLHNATGVWLLLPIALLAVTGSYFTWPRQYRAAIAWVSPLTPSEVPKSDVTARRSAPPRLQDMVAEARDREPDARVVRVAIPGRADQPYTVFFADGTSHAARHMTRYFYDQHTGELLGVKRPGASQTLGDMMVAWLGPLHTGNFGGPGVKVLWFLFGLAPAVLFATGFLMWWNRVVVRRWRVHDGAEARRGRVPTMAP